MKASEVLQQSIQDIEDGKWVCNELHEKNFNAGPNPKEMACAVGLVSLNSGDTKTIKISKRDLGYYYAEVEDAPKCEVVNVSKDSGPNSGASCQIHKESGIKIGDSFEVARYPKGSSPQETKDAIKYLYHSIPGESQEDYASYEKNNLDNMTSNVVNYNDREIRYGGPEAAKEWFEDARKLAIQDGN